MKEKIEGYRAIIAVYDKVEQLKKEIETLVQISLSNTFCLSIFLSGDSVIDNYTMSITSENIMQNSNGELFDSFLNGLIESKQKELESYMPVIESIENKMEE